ncbi:hypothetical protein BG910_11210 [Neisseria chenwenguii]|uniref:Uncharacterized protein n=1 Tax=Neisseria chenwenguii TaxID=1853278 RepID=A0A220S4U6_9NEIS|nr:hypothetical protein BG910_11210 [Neisseria chenwenguii]ROV57349.1 hypothetical protein EGS38_01325 [Neisseria chenwenguii]
MFSVKNRLGKIFGQKSGMPCFQTAWHGSRGAVVLRKFQTAFICKRMPSEKRTRPLPYQGRYTAGAADAGWFFSCRRYSRR